MYPELNKQLAFNWHYQKEQLFPISHDISQKGLWIPSHPKLSRSNLDKIINLLNQFKPN